MAIFKFAYRMCFVFLPMIIYAVIFPLFFGTKSTIPAEEQNNIDVAAFVHLLIYSLTIFVVIYFMHKFIGKRIILVPLIIGICVLLDGLMTNLKSEGAIGFYYIELPLLATTSIYSIGFIINDIFISKKIIKDDDNKDNKD